MNTYYTLPESGRAILVSARSFEHAVRKLNLAGIKPRAVIEEKKENGDAVFNQTTKQIYGTRS